MGREQVTGIRKMVDEEDKVEDLVVDAPEAETAEAAVVEAEVDEAPVVEAIEAEAIEDESVTAEPDLAAAAEASEPAPVEAPVAEATEVPAAEAAVAAAAVKKEPASNRRWYVVHAYSGFESYVKKVLESRIAERRFVTELWRSRVSLGPVAQQGEGGVTAGG